MDSRTFKAVSDSAATLAEYQGLADELRAIAKFIAEPTHKKRLLAIAKFLEREVPDQLFNSAKLTAFEVLRLLSDGDYLSDEEMGAKLGRAASTTKQMVAALKAGGVEFEESTAKGFRVKGGRGYGKKRAVS